MIKCLYNMGTLSRSNWNLGARKRTNNKVNPHYDAESGNRTRASLVGGECFHHCAIPAPHQVTVTDLCGISHFKNIIKHTITSERHINKNLLQMEKSSRHWSLKYFPPVAIVSLIHQLTFELFAWCEP